MDFPVYIDAISMDLSIYKGSQVEISKFYLNYQNGNG